LEQQERYHDLMPNPVASGEENNAMLLRKRLNLLVFLEVGLALVLNVMIECEYHLARIFNLSGAYGHELLRNGPGVVVS
jgi:hypothetical protein